MKSPVLATILVVLCASSVVAAPSAADKCVAAKDKAVGKFLQCLAKADVTAIKDEAPVDDDRCDDGLDKAWTKAEAGASCPTMGDLETVRAAAGLCEDDVLADLGNPMLGVQCHAAKTGTVGKYFSCRAGTTGKAILAGNVPEYLKCDSKMDSGWTKAETKYPGECPTTGDLVAVRAAAALCSDAILDGLAGPTTTTTSTTTTTMEPSLIFADGFESGDTAAWSLDQVFGMGSFIVNGAAALDGSFGFRASAPNFSSAAYVEDESPEEETVYRARFRVDLDPLGTNALAGPATPSLVSAGSIPFASSAFNVYWRLDPAPAGNTWEVGMANNSDGGPTGLYWIDAPDGPFEMIVEWAAATAPGANDGLVRMAVSGGATHEETGLDNDQRRVGYIRFGLISPNGNISAVIDIDDFESHRTLLP